MSNTPSHRPPEQCYAAFITSIRVRNALELKALINERDRLLREIAFYKEFNGWFCINTEQRR